MNRPSRQRPLVRAIVPALLAGLLLAPLTGAIAGGESGWESYGRDPGGSRYSPLADINRGNVGQLVKAWEYHTGELERHPDRKAFASFHVTPLLLPAAAASPWCSARHSTGLSPSTPATGPR